MLSSDAFRLAPSQFVLWHLQMATNRVRAEHSAVIHFGQIA